MKYFSGVLQVKVKVTVSPGLIRRLELKVFFTLIWQPDETPAFNLIVTVTLSAARRGIVNEPKEKKWKGAVLLVGKSITCLSTHP